MTGEEATMNAGYPRVRPGAGTADAPLTAEQAEAEILRGILRTRDKELVEARKERKEWETAALDKRDECVKLEQELAQVREQLKQFMK